MAAGCFATTTDSASQPYRKISVLAGIVTDWLAAGKREMDAFHYMHARKQFALRVGDTSTSTSGVREVVQYHVRAGLHHSPSDRRKVLFQTGYKYFQHSSLDRAATGQQDIISRDQQGGTGST